MVLTADTAFIAAATVAAPNVLRASNPVPSKSLDQVVVTLGGVRIELTGSACRFFSRLSQAIPPERAFAQGGFSQFLDGRSWKSRWAKLAHCSRTPARGSQV